MKSANQYARNSIMVIVDGLKRNHKDLQNKELCMISESVMMYEYLIIISHRPLLEVLSLEIKQTH